MTQYCLQEIKNESAREKELDDEYIVEEVEDPPPGAS